MSEWFVFLTYLLLMLMLLTTGRLAWVEGYDSALFATISISVFVGRLVFRWGLVVFTETTPERVALVYPGLVEPAVVVVSNLLVSVSVFMALIELAVAHSKGTVLPGPRLWRRIFRATWDELVSTKRA